MHLNRDIIPKIPFLARYTNDVDDGFISYIMGIMNPMFVVPEDYIFKEGSIGLEMYFLVKGTVEVVVMEAASPKERAHVARGKPIKTVLGAGPAIQTVPAGARTRGGDATSESASSCSETTTAGGDPNGSAAQPRHVPTGLPGVGGQQRYASSGNTGAYGRGSGSGGGSNTAKVTPASMHQQPSAPPARKVMREAVVAELHEGSFFGEIAVLIGSKRTASVRAVTYCNLFTLRKDDLNVMILHFPNLAGMMQVSVRACVQRS